VGAFVDLLGGNAARVEPIAGHDRTGDEITLDEVERITI
jgi:hypothetical protein